LPERADGLGFHAGNGDASRRGPRLGWRGTHNSRGEERQAPGAAATTERRHVRLLDDVGIDADAHAPRRLGIDRVWQREVAVQEEKVLGMVNRWLVALGFLWRW
jgi:hypothetical protein